MFPFYNDASANIRLVGRQMCYLMKSIRRIYFNDVWDKDLHIHCIGHSLGAHACGYAGADCDGKFDRITGMDPAGPNYEPSDYRVRVDPSDAKFVDIIHTNGGTTLLTGSAGMLSATGHVSRLFNNLLLLIQT